MTITTRAIRIHRHGGPEVLELERMELPPIGPAELRIRHLAIGVNFADIYQRKGEAGPHHKTIFPAILGAQGAGIVEEVGADVREFAVGEKVSYLHTGSYCADHLVPAARTVKLPEGISAELAAGWLARGMTAEYLLRRLYPVKAGDTVLIHAAAGGMGMVLSQWARALGAHVIGTVGSREKTGVARSYGCNEVIDYRSEDFVSRVGEITGGAGVNVVYDAVGKDVFLGSLECLRPMGWIVSYGAASGPVGAFDIQLLHHKSLIVTRPTLRTYTATTEDLRRSAATFFDAVATGAVRLAPPHRYALEDVRVAHANLQNRRTTGVSILVP